MKKSVFYSLHAFVILVFLTFIVLSSKGLSSHYNEPFLHSFLDSFLQLGTFLACLYLSYYLFIPKYILKKEYWKFVLGFILIIVGFTLFFNYTALFVATVLKVKFHVFVKGWWSGIAIYFFILGMVGTFFRLFVQWIKDANDKIELEKQNYKSELSLLKNQLNPHFLFNTLNNIDSLIIEKSENASLALNKLSEIMRYMVYDSEKELVPLQDEIKYIQNYISLQKLRMPNENIIELKIEGNISNKQIPPVLFIPFVENAFKHSSLKDRPDNKIQVKINIEDDGLSFHCFNTIADINKDKSSGVGLDLVKKRLDLIYKNNYSLVIDKVANEFTVNLNLKFV